VAVAVGEPRPGAWSIRGAARRGGTTCRARTSRRVCDTPFGRGHRQESQLPHAPSQFCHTPAGKWVRRADGATAAGHTSLEATMVYTHAAERSAGAPSPLETLPE
jgi:hypothetical protein